MRQAIIDSVYAHILWLSFDPPPTVIDTQIDRTTRGRAAVVPLAVAVAELVRDGDTVALEGFTHLIPFAAGHEIIRAGPARPDARPHDARHRLRPDDRHGLRAPAGLLVGRQPRRRQPAPLPRRRRERLARARSRSRSTAMRGWRTATRPAPPGCPSPSSAATRAATSCAQTDRSRPGHVPVHRRGADAP